MSSSLHPAAAYPTWVPKPKCPVTVVVGPPGNGAESFVKERMGEGDVLIQLVDFIEQLSGVSAARAGTEFLIPALRARNEALQALASHPPVGRAWVVAPSPKGWQRQFWADVMGAQVIVLDPGKTAAVLAARAAGISERFVHQWYSEADSTAGPGAEYVPPLAPAGPRPSAEKRGYGRTHRVLRDEQLLKEPICRICFDQRGERVAATVLDHIRPFKKLDGSIDYKLWGDPKNHRSLCLPCHQSRGAQRNRGEAAGGTAGDGRPLDPSHPWNRKKL